MTEQEKKSAEKALRKARLRKSIRLLFGRRVVIVAFIGVLLFVLMAIFADVIAPYDPNIQSVYEGNQGPSAAHWLGTDNFGRDVLSRIIYGSRVSLIVGVASIAFAAVAGVILGLAAAYFGGKVDAIIMRLTEILMSIPRVVLAMSLIAIFGSGITNMAIILGVSTVPSFVRMMRAQALSVQESDYVKASLTQGAKSFYAMFRHILPNAISPIIVMMTQYVGATILMESGLSYLGIGISIPTPSWGTMIADGKSYLILNPTAAISPGVFIALLVVCLNVLGDGVRDMMDPRLRGEI